jgi:hypothetical protein
MVDQSISWSFDGPLATPLDNVIIAQGLPVKWFKLNEGRKLKQIEHFHALLVIAETVFDRSNAPAYRALSRAVVSQVQTKAF